MGKAEGPKLSSKIIKAGALLPDTRILLDAWDPAAPADENLRRFRRENIFAKASRSRVEDILAIFRQRYVAPPGVLGALLRLVRRGAAPDVLTSVLYFHAAQADPLIRAIVLDAVWPAHETGGVLIREAEIESALKGYSDGGRTSRPWSGTTSRRIAQGLLSTLRDFGILEGNVRKRIAAPHLPLPAFAHVAFFLAHGGPGLSGRGLVAAEEWRLFLLETTSVERLFLEAHQRHLLEYQAAGTMVRIAFPCESLEAYADVVTDRTA